MAERERNDGQDTSNARRDRVNEDGRPNQQQRNREEQEPREGRDEAPKNTGRPGGAPWLGGG